MPKAKPRPLPTEQDRLFRMPDVESITGHRRSTIYAWIKDGRFPAPVKVGTFSSAWRKRDIDQWYASRGTGQ